MAKQIATKLQQIYVTLRRLIWVFLSTHIYIIYIIYHCDYPYILRVKQQQIPSWTPSKCFPISWFHTQFHLLFSLLLNSRLLLSPLLLCHGECCIHLHYQVPMPKPHRWTSLGLGVKRFWIPQRKRNRSEKGGKRERKIKDFRNSAKLLC